MAGFRRDKYTASVPRADMLDLLNLSTQSEYIAPCAEQFVENVCNGRLRLPSDNKVTIYDGVSVLAKEWASAARALLRVSSAIGIAVAYIVPEKRSIRVLDHSRLAIYIRRTLESKISYKVVDLVDNRVLEDDQFVVFEETPPVHGYGVRGASASIVSRVQRARAAAQNVELIDESNLNAIRDSSRTTLVLQEQKMTKTEVVAREQEMARNLDATLFEESGLIPEGMGNNSTIAVGSGAPPYSYISMPEDDESDGVRGAISTLKVEQTRTGLYCVSINKKMELANVIQSSTVPHTEAIRERSMNEIRRVFGLFDPLRDGQKKNNGQSTSDTKLNNAKLAVDKNKSAFSVDTEDESATTTRAREQITDFLNTVWVHMDLILQRKIEQEQLEAFSNVGPQPDEVYDGNSGSLSWFTGAPSIHTVFDAPGGPPAAALAEVAPLDALASTSGVTDAVIETIGGQPDDETRGKRKKRGRSGEEEEEEDENEDEDEKVEDPAENAPPAPPQEKTVHWVRMPPFSIMMQIFASGLLKHEACCEYLTAYCGLPANSCRTEAQFNKFTETINGKKDDKAPAAKKKSTAAKKKKKRKS